MSPSNPLFPDQPQRSAETSAAQAALEPAVLERRSLPSRKLVINEEGNVEAGGQPPALTNSITPVILLIGLRRRWQQAVPLGLVLAALIGAGVWFLRPDLYTAYVLLRVAQSQEPLIKDHSQNTTPAVQTNQFQKSQVALITNRNVLRMALKDEKVRNLPLLKQQVDPVSWLEEELKAELVPNTEILRLELSAREHTKDLAPIVNAVQKAYMEVIVKDEQRQQLALLADMEQIYAKSQENVRKQREALRKLANDMKTGDSQILTIKQKNLLEQSAALKKELFGLEARMRDAHIKLASHKLRVEASKSDQMAPGIVSSSPQELVMATRSEREIEQDATVQKAQTEVAQLESAIAQAKQMVRNPNDDFLVQRQNDLKKAKEALEKLRGDRRKVSIERMRQNMFAEGLFHTKEVEEELKVLTSQREKLVEEAIQVSKDLEHLGVRSTELELMRTDIEQSELVLKALRHEKERLSMEVASTARSRVKTTGDADDATVLKKARRYIEAGAGAFAGLLLGLFMISYQEVRSRKLYTANEVSNGLRLRVVGTLPLLPTRQGWRRQRLPASGSWSQLLLESIDSIRTLLLQSRPEEGSAVLMVASACSGEGKTTLATHLATSLARAGKRTLLIDCDLRSPSLHRLFQLARVPGICELLCGTSNREQTIHETPVPGLHLLPAGQYCPEAATALARGDLRLLLAQLRQQFDFIVADSSPVLAVSDALIVGKDADGVVFSIRPGVSQAPYVYAAYERLRELDMPFLGTVVNGVNDDFIYAHNQNYLQSARS